MTNCKYCKADCAFKGEDVVKECRGFVPMTNADHIRAMTDEELAKWLYEFFWGRKGDVRLCVLGDWLKQLYGGADHE